jgi:hypothetical protein
MCGAISGFHALVSSGTTPKMISREGDVRMIGYGAMLIEGLVGVVALIAAAALPQGDYWAINIDLSRVGQFAETLEKMNANTDNLGELEQQVGGEALRGRTGGAVTLAVGMSRVLTDASQRLFGETLRNPDRAILVAGDLGQIRLAVRENRLVSRLGDLLGDRRGGLGGTDRDRFDRDDLADVRDRQSGWSCCRWRLC